MMMNKGRVEIVETHHPELTPAEVASLWTQYMNETKGFCINRYMLEKVGDSNIQSLFKYAIHLGENHVEKIKAFLSRDNFPIPQGFTDNDVDIRTPRLFTDQFCLHFLNIMYL
jgi:hypothetical protein